MNRISHQLQLLLLTSCVAFASACIQLQEGDHCGPRWVTDDFSTGSAECGCGLVCVCGVCQREQAVRDNGGRLYPDSTIQCPTYIAPDWALECVADTDCKGSMICYRRLARPACFPPHSGQVATPCNRDDECAFGLQCNRALSTPRCIAPASMAAGQPCESNEQCFGGRGCVVAANGYAPGTCREPGAPGEVCYEVDDCQLDLRCIYPGDGPDPICSVPLARGDSCSTDSDCTSFTCSRNVCM